ncbi:hypothetical protein [uncultured Pseudacidovorax sp.]|uniref:hypothetical protein n=1 Tax=uncultured Pseudacidovorax sp. TaxID=679313 RepID=UPI0025CF3A71|nr:hypothetical protein [uncultured Pseudacidovorax sp.]
MAVSRKALFGKLNTTLFRAVESAAAFARLRGNPYVELAHWLHQLWQLPDSDVHRIARHFGIKPEEVDEGLAGALSSLPKGATSLSDLSYHLSDAVECAWLVASVEFGRDRIRSAWLLAALLQSEERRTRLLRIVPAFARIDVERLAKDLPTIISASPEGREGPHDGANAEPHAVAAMSTAESAPKSGSALERYCTDLTARARDGQIDPVIGRQLEVRGLVDYRSHASGIGGSVEEQLHAHMQIYWRWRLQHLGEVDKLPSYARARRQDQIDMWESERDFTSDVFKALAAEYLSLERQVRPGPVKLPLSPAQRDFVKVRADLLCRRDAGVPKTVDRFFDEMAHDSHASFYMAGPVTEADRTEKIKQIARKYDDAKRNLETLVRQGHAPLTPDQIEKAATLSLSELEQRIHDFQKAHPGEFPEISDADRWALLGMEDLGTGVVVWGLTDKTRREPGGHMRYRRVFDKS